MMISAVLGLLLCAAESDYYVVETIPSPEGEVIEVGGLDMLPDGSLAVSTRRGRVWIIENPTAEDPADATWHLFADGLAEGLGLKVVDGDIHVIQRTELSRLRDEDGDRRVDHIDTISQGWGITNNYHEYAYGLPVDDEGNFYVSLNLAFINPEWWHGQSQVPWRGWVLRISPSGEVTPMAHGFRSPCGIGMNVEGDLFVTDNQGDWMPVCPIFHVKDGGFYGHPNSLRWTEDWKETGGIPSDREPVSEARRPAAIWIPYDWSRSAGNLVPDTTGGRFGPFDEQLFVAELTNGMVLRADLEKVNGEYQGAIWPFRTRVGSACRIRFGPDGTLFTGLTNRGWGGMEPAYGIRRIRWTGVDPMEMSNVHLLPDGFEIDFTRPVSPDIEITLDDIKARTYRYNWWWEYGSPEQDITPLAVTEADLSEDRRRLTIRIPDLQAGQCVRVGLHDVQGEGGHDLLHPEFSYTVNQLPGDTSPAPLVARRVAPPLKRGAGSEEGWLRLTWGDPLDRVHGKGWRLGGSELDEQGDFEVVPGNDLLINDPSSSGDLVLPVGETDGRLRLSLFLPGGGSVGIGLAGGSRIVLRDHDSDPPGATIQVLDGDGAILVEEEIEYWFGPGQWQTLEIDQQGPRHDASGRQLDRGRIGIYLEKFAVMDAIELPMTSGDEIAGGQLRVLGDVGPAGVADIRFHPMDHRRPDGGVSLLSKLAIGGGLREGKIQDERQDNRLMFTGVGRFVWHVPLPSSYVVSARLRFTEHTHATLDLGDGLSVHLGQDVPGEPATGAITGVDDVTAQWIPDGAWFDLAIAVGHNEAGRHATVSLNGIRIAGGVIPTPAEMKLGILSPWIRLDSGSLEFSSLHVVPIE